MRISGTQSHIQLGHVERRVMLHLPGLRAAAEGSRALLRYSELRFAKVHVTCDALFLKEEVNVLGKYLRL